VFNIFITFFFPCRCKNKYSVTRALKILYGATYDTEIAKIIVSASTVDMIKNLFDLMNQDDNCDYYEDSNTYQVKGIKRFLYNEGINFNERL
jgi:hypothetical protein